jgi:hypothetical protein
MFTARTVVVIVALCAGGCIAAASASPVDNEFSVPAGTRATAAVARPAIADEPIPAIQPAPAPTASTPLVRRVTAQK